MAKKKNNLTLEEKLQNALVPKEEQPYQIPDNWVWTRLGNIAYLFTGNSISSKVKESKYFGKIEGLSYIATKDISFDHQIDYNNGVRIDDYQNFRIATSNTPLLCIEGGSSGKKIGFVLEDVCFGNKLCAFETQNLNSKLIYYYLQTDVFVNQFNNKRHGLIGGVSVKELNQISISLPPLLEQQRKVERIESLFSKLDEAKEKIQMALDSFETRKSAILYQAFSGELTKKWREENGLRLDDWNNGTLQSVCSIKITDGTHQTPKYTSEENGIPFLSAKDIVTGKIKWDKIKYITEELHEELYKRVAPQKEDLLLAKNGTTGIAAIVEDDKIFDIYVTLALLRADYKKVFYRFLYYLINSPICKEQFNSKLTGIGVPNLHLRDIRNVEIAYPSLEEQKEIVRILDTIFEKEQDTQELIDLIEKIDLMKKSILARAFRGELGTNLPEEESAIELLKSILEEQ